MSIPISTSGGSSTPIPPAGLLQAPSLRAFEEQSSERLLWNFSGRSTGELVHIGNYLNPALREGILDSFFWVVPDRFLETPRQRKLLVGMLNDIQKAHPRAMDKPSWVDRSITAAIYGKQMTVCALSDLPELDEEVLLDLGSDFMVIDRVTECYPLADPGRTTPWIWPDELVARLAARGVRSDFVTIAYSVEGGYTPLGYKYLGDDLARLLGHEGDLSKAERDLMALKRQAAEAHETGDVAEAVSVCERALARDPTDASIYYRLAQLCSEQGWADRARRHYGAAVALDPSYHTSYNNLGPVYASIGQPAAAQTEYRKALTRDPDDAAAHFGLADLYVSQRRWNDAIEHYERAAELKPDGPAPMLVSGGSSRSSGGGAQRRRSCCRR